MKRRLLISFLASSGSISTIFRTHHRPQVMMAHRRVLLVKSTRTLMRAFDFSPSAATVCRHGATTGIRC